MKTGIIIGHLNHKGNEGSLIRTAEALGFNNVFVLGKKEDIYKTSEGADRHVIFNEFKSEDDLVRHLLKNNFSLVCIENINSAIDIDKLEKYPKNPIFISGNEKLGVPQELLSNATICVKIPQGGGYVNCLNTAIAGSIVLYDFFRKQRSKRKELWDG